MKVTTPAIFVVTHLRAQKEENRPDSDIDILIICPRNTKIKYTKGEYFYDFEGREINTVLRSIERLRKLAGQGFNEFEAEFFRKSEILWEKDKEVTELINKLSPKLGKRKSSGNYNQ